MSELKEVIKRKFNYSDQEADGLIKEAKEALYEYLDEGDTESAEDICEEYFGLEPDYLDELMF